MSRSYRKYPSIWTSEFGHPEWSAFRIREKKCINEEHRSNEYGDVLFPQYYGSCKGSWSSSARVYFSVKKIHDEYLKEIRDILNGYVKKSIYQWKKPVDYQKVFVDEFYRIKYGIDQKGTGSCFEWLNFKKIKAAIKNWNGAPLDILYYLNRSGLIKKAICIGMQVRRMDRK